MMSFWRMWGLNRKCELTLNSAYTCIYYALLCDGSPLLICNIPKITGVSIENYLHVLIVFIYEVKFFDQRNIPSIYMLTLL